MIWLIIQLILGLGLILIGANFLIDGSSTIARKFGISEFVVGLTIVGIGTSTPEMVVSFISAIQGNSDIAIGNVVGSNIANVFMILGLVAIVSPMPLIKNNLFKDIPIALIASILLFVLGFDTIFRGAEVNILSRIDGGILMTCFILFMIYSFKSSQNEVKVEEKIEAKPKKIWISILILAAGLGTLIFGGKIFVEAGISLASTFGLSDAFIGITIMAIGTSIPELAASLVAALKKKSQMALGNIIGSNIANIFLILGGSALINPLTMSNITLVDMGVLLATSVFIFLAAYTFKKNVLDKWDGVIFFGIYIGYITWLLSQLS